MIDLQQVQSVYKNLSLRERGLVFATILAATWGLWIVTFGGALIDEGAQLQAQVKQTDEQLALISQQYTQLQQQGNSSEVRQLKEQSEALLESVNFAQDELDQVLARFVPPHRVALLLEDMLTGHPGLQLVSLSSQASEKITLQLQEPLQPSSSGSEPFTDTSELDIATMDVYRHPFQLELVGSFHDVLSYLDQLESGQWQFQWRSLDYAVEEYPAARVTLLIETLSRSEDWIGV